MPNSARRRLLLTTAAVGLGLLSYELWPSDERAISVLLNELCAKLNETRDSTSLVQLQTALDSVLLPNASLHVSELELDAQGADEISTRARLLLTSGVPLSFALSSVAVHLSGRLAQVDLDLIVTVRGSGEQTRDLRHTHVRLAKSGASWRIEAVDIDPVAPSQPEARP